MLRHPIFYHASLRNYVTIFGTLFNEIYINRTDSSNNIVSVIKVPITYAPKDKILARYIEDPNIDRESQITLPRMSFEMGSPVYDPDRKLNTMGSINSLTTDSGKMSRLYNPVPYNFPFSLYVFVKNTEDGTKIIEQILPFFTPDWPITVELIDPIDLKMDIHVVLLSVNQQDNYDGAFVERRSLIWTLNFILKGFLWGPLRTSPVIKQTRINKYIMGSNSIVEYQTITPGLTANGEPTGNSSLSVNSNLIFANSDFGYIVTESGGPLINE